MVSIGHRPGSGFWYAIAKASREGVLSSILYTLVPHRKKPHNTIYDTNLGMALESIENIY